MRRAPDTSAAETSPATYRKFRLGLPRTFSALNNRDYRLLWIGTLGSFMAMQMSMVARGYLAYALTGSATILGFVMFARALPQFLFTLFGGVLADRLPKRNLLLVTQTLTGLCVLVTAILVVTDVITIWQLIMLGFIEGAIFSFNMPARQAILPEIVGQKNLMNAVALNNAGMNFTQVFGPAFVGLLISWPAVGLSRVFFIQAACYLLPILTLTQIRPVAARAGRAKAPMLEELQVGLRYVKRHDVLAMLLVIGLVPTLLGFSYQSLLPVFASDEVLDVGPSGLGFMYMASGLGALAGSLLLASYNDFRRRGLAQLVVGAAWGATLMFFGMSGHYAVALAALALVGLTASAYRSLNSTLITVVTDQQFYGRVMSIQMLGFSISMLTPLPIGFIVDQIGAPLVVTINGGLIMLFVFAVGSLVRSYRHLEVTVPTGDRPATRPSPAG